MIPDPKPTRRAVGSIELDRIPRAPTLGDPRLHVYGRAFDLGYSGSEPIELPAYTAPSWRQALATGFQHGAQVRGWLVTLGDPADFGTIPPGPARQLWTAAGMPEPDGSDRGVLLLAAAHALWEGTGLVSGRAAAEAIVRACVGASVGPEGPGDPADPDDFAAALWALGILHPEYYPPGGDELPARIIDVGRLRDL